MFIVAFNGLWPLEHGPRLDEQAGMALGCSDGLSLNVPGEGGPNGVGRKRHFDWLSGIWVGGRGKGRGSARYKVLVVARYRIHFCWVIDKASRGN